MPTNHADPATSAFHRGIAAFRAEDYRRSIQLFDHAIQLLVNQPSPIKPNLFDSRAAAKEKLNDLKGALEDAQRTIHLAPNSNKGYIRAARLFNRIRKFASSIKMYELAIAKSSSNSVRCSSAVQTLRDELEQVRIQQHTTSMVEKKAKTNSSGCLPVELFIYIVSYLDTRSRFRCMSVCWIWRATILSTSSLWTSLSLAGTNHQRLIPKLSFWLDRLRPHRQLESLSIQHFAPWPASTLRALLTRLATTPTSEASISAPRLQLNSFTFQLADANCGINSMRNLVDDVVTFVYFNRFSLVNLSLSFPTSVVHPRTLQSFLSDFPRLKKLNVDCKSGEQIMFERPPDLERSYLGSIKGSPLSSQPQQNIASSGSDESSIAIDSLTADLKLPCLEEVYFRGMSFSPSNNHPLQLRSLRKISVPSARPTRTLTEQFDSSDYCTPVIDVSDLPLLEDLFLHGSGLERARWAPVWSKCEQFYRLRRLELQQLPEFLVHFLDLAAVPFDWDPSHYQDAPCIVGGEPIAPQLRSLSLCDHEPFVTCKFLAVFAHQFTQLDSLSLEGLELDVRSEAMVISALRILPALTQLCLNNTRARSEVLDAIKPGQLDHLQILNCTRITFRSLARLVQTKLTYLDITGCQLISTREMIEWLGRNVQTLVWQANPITKEKATKRLFLDI